MNPTAAANPSNPAAAQAAAPDELAAIKALVQTAEHTLLRVFHQNLAALANIDDLTKVTDNIARLAAIRKTIAQLSQDRGAGIPACDSPPVRSSSFNSNPDPSDPSDPSNPSDPSDPPNHSSGPASSSIPHSLEQARADLRQVATATAQLAQSGDSPHLGATSTPSSPSTPSIPAHSSPSSHNSHDSHNSQNSPASPLPYSKIQSPISRIRNLQSQIRNPKWIRNPKSQIRNASLGFRASSFEIRSFALRAIPRAKLAAALHRVNAYITTTLTPIVLETFRRTRDKRLIPQLFHLLFHTPVRTRPIPPLGPLPPLFPDG